MVQLTFSHMLIHDFAFNIFYYRLTKIIKVDTLKIYIETINNILYDIIFHNILIKKI